MTAFTPLLALVVPMKVLVPVWTLLPISSSATLFGKNRRHVSMPQILRILPFMLLGIFLGDRIHTGMSGATFQRVVCVILVFSGIPLMLK